VGALLVITVGAGHASMSTNAVGAFHVGSSVDAGVPSPAAGRRLVAGGAADTMWGWLADRTATLLRARLSVSGVRR
jgi:hypothetical protein